MKHTIIDLLVIAGVASIAFSPGLNAATHKRASAPVVITPPAVPDGSNWSRAPFPAARPQNDVTPPKGEAFDQSLPPNTPSTTPEPEAPPPPTFAILQPKVEPGLMPTGRPTTSAAMALDAPRIEPTIRSASFEARDDLVDSLRLRLRQSEETVNEFRRTETEMNPEGRSQFDAQLGEVKARQKTLDKTLRTAANASAGNWDSARAQLASDYDALASALAQMDAAVGVAPVRRG